MEFGGNVAVNLSVVVENLAESDEQFDPRRVHPNRDSRVVRGAKKHLCRAA